MKKSNAWFGAAATLILLGVGCTNSTTTTDSKTTDTIAATDDTELLYDEDSIEVITEDAYGKDLTVVERYPDSIRSYYAASQYETDVSYQTTASQEDIRQYYTEKLIADGWTNSEEATDYMEYLKGDESNPEILTLYLTDYKQQGIVEYELVYEPALSDEELKELEAEDVEFEF